MNPMLHTDRSAAGHCPAGFEQVERCERAFYEGYLVEGMLVFDVGANVGLLTALFAERVGRRGSVHAFEPGGKAFARLASRLGPGEGHNVRLQRSALADRTGSATLHVYDDDHLTWNTFADRPLHEYGIDVSPVGRERVEVTTIDEYCADRGVSHIDLLKIDVEGAELQVLLGARGMLQDKRVGCCVFEFGQTTLDMGNEPARIEAFLDRVGYDLRNLIAGDPVFPTLPGKGTPAYSMHLAEPRP
ncbi:MAG: FkbM family methyltransferase [Planctomycetes bacterium]|nr:FkbM family methyltransferase [Planctomycetota bacterium]